MPPPPPFHAHVEPPLCFSSPWMGPTQAAFSWYALAGLSAVGTPRWPPERCRPHSAQMAPLLPQQRLHPASRSAAPRRPAPATWPPLPLDGARSRQAAALWLSTCPWLLAMQRRCQGATSDTFQSIRHPRRRRPSRSRDASTLRGSCRTTCRPLHRCRPSLLWARPAQEKQPIGRPSTGEHHPNR